MPPALKTPRLKLLGQTGGLVVYLVDGEHIRNHVDIDFTCGGNEAVYPNYVPKNEIWIDDALSPLDRTATLLHEIVERNLMVNKGWNYERAHDAASTAEKPFRKQLQANRPKTIDLPLVELELAKAPRAAADPNQRKERVKARVKAKEAAAEIQAGIAPIKTRAGRKKTIVVKPAKAPPAVEREYPRVAAVGRKRKRKKRDHEIADLLQGSAPEVANFLRGGTPAAHMRRLTMRR